MVHMARMSVVVPKAVLHARRPAAKVAAVASLMFRDRNRCLHRELRPACQILTGQAIDARHQQHGARDVWNVMLKPVPYLDLLIRVSPLYAYPDYSSLFFLICALVLTAAQPQRHWYLVSQ